MKTIFNRQSQIINVLSASARVHFEVGVLFQETEGDIGAAVARGGAFFGATIGAPLPDGLDEAAERVGRRAGAERTAQIGAVLGVQAQEQHAVGGETRAIAGTAEGLCRGRDAQPFVEHLPHRGGGRP